MNESLSILHRTAAESYAAGARDSRRFMQLYRAYLRSAYDADSGFGLTLAAMTFALAAWFITMYFVFK